VRVCSDNRIMAPNTRFAHRVAVWLDLTDDDAAVPRFDGAIVAKVARLTFSGGAEPSGLRAPARVAAPAPSRAQPRPAGEAATKQTAARPKPATASPRHVAASPTPEPAAVPTPPPAGNGSGDGDMDLWGGPSDTIDSADTPSALGSAVSSGDHGDFEGLFSGDPGPSPSPAPSPAPAASLPMGAGPRRNPASAAFTASSLAASKASKPAASGSGDFADLVDM
jgi:hypothetical protein